MGSHTEPWAIIAYVVCGLVLAFCIGASFIRNPDKTEDTMQPHQTEEMTEEREMTSIPHDQTEHGMKQRKRGDGGGGAIRFGLGFFAILGIIWTTTYS
jgi:uncharacterized membrane protein YraQ (UPF0718 family)